MRAVILQATDFALREMDQFWLAYGDNRTIMEVMTLLEVTDNIAVVTAGAGTGQSWEEMAQVSS